MSSCELDNIKNQNECNIKLAEDHAMQIADKDDDEVIKCTCPRNNCSKAYCKCFLNGISCKPGACTCTGCTNHEDAEGFAETLQRRNEFRQNRLKMNENNRHTCNCSRNNCSKRYCPCYKSGQGCHPQCNCQNCENKFNKKPVNWNVAVHELKIIKMRKTNLILNLL